MLARFVLVVALSAALIAGAGAALAFYGVFRGGPGGRTGENRPPLRTARSPGCTGGGYYGLTFDDGPNTTYTPQIEAELDSLGVKATFFLLGESVDRAPRFAKSLVDAGDWVGNHSYSHPDLTTLSAAQVRDQLSRADRAIENATGVRPHFVRPPYSRFNDQTLSVFKELNLEYAGWTVDSKDWEVGEPVREIVANAVTVKDGGIIVMHDTSARTVAAVPQIVEQLKERGLCPGKLAVTPGQRISSPVGVFSVKAVRP